MEVHWGPQHSKDEGKQIFDFEFSFVYIQESCPTEKKTLKNKQNNKNRMYYAYICGIEKGTLL